MNEFRNSHLCPFCQDAISGLVDIWNPLFVEACDEDIQKCPDFASVYDRFLDWKAETGGAYQTHAVACCCESEAAKAHKRRNVPEYDPQRHCKAGSLVKLKKFLSDQSRYEMSFD